MHALLKSLITDLHSVYFKPNGFKKVRQYFSREIGNVMQGVEFQSSSWNSSNEPITFYINISVGFTDIPMKDGKPAFTGRCRIASIASNAPPQFDLVLDNYEEVKSQLLSLLPHAVSELHNHYEDVRSRARAGLHTPIPLPETWRS